MKAIKCAEALKEAFEIGTFSQFCDEPASFEPVEINELAEIIRKFYPETVAASPSLKFLDTGRDEE